MLDSLIKISSNYYRNKVCNNNVSYADYLYIYFECGVAKVKSITRN